MTVTLTWNTILTVSAVIGAIVAITAYFAKVVRWVDKQSKQDEQIKSLQKHHNADISAIQVEQTLLVYGILACLKGLKEKGCNGPVTEAIDKIEKHINQKAHE